MFFSRSHGILGKCEEKKNRKTLDELHKSSNSNNEWQQYASMKRPEMERKPASERTNERPNEHVCKLCMSVI